MCKLQTDSKLHGSNFAIGHCGPDFNIFLYMWTYLYRLQAYDATHIVKSYHGPPLDILIDQGKDDQFLSAGQLLPDNFIAACTERKVPVVFRMQQVTPFSSHV